MIYIKVIENEDEVLIDDDTNDNDTLQQVELAGSVVNGNMLKEGYFKYEGVIPDCPFLKWDPVKQILVEYLDDIKKERNAEIKAEFEEAISNGFTTSFGVKLDADMGSIGMLSSGVQLELSLNGNDNTQIMPIRDYDNIPHFDKTIAEVFQMTVELGSNFKTLLGRKWNAQGLISMATTYEEVMNVTF